MIDGFDLLKENSYTSMRDFINDTMLINYGIITEVNDDGTVAVEMCYKRSNALIVVNCTYLQQSSSNFESNNKPENGDKVLVLVLQYKDEAQFTATEPLEVSRDVGYTMLNCVAVPFGTMKNSAKTKVSFTDTEVNFTTSLDVKANAASFTLNDGTKGAARKDDAVEVTIPALSFVIEVNNHVGILNPTPITVTGKITEASDTTKIGD